MPTKAKEKKSPLAKVADKVKAPLAPAATTAPMTSSIPQTPDVLKPGILRDDLFEDIVHRSYVMQQGIQEDASLRVTPVYDQKTKTGKLISSGRKDLQSLLDEAISSKSIEHDKQTLSTYPGDEAFESQAESFKTIAVPRLAATMQAVRKRLEAPLNKLEDGAVHLEKDVQEKFSKLFGGSVSEAGDGGRADGGEGGQWQPEVR